MIKSNATAALDELFDPVTRCLTPEVARKVVALRVSPELQTKMDALAEKSTEGVLTPEERDAYETYVRALNFISILQIKARKVITS